MKEMLDLEAEILRHKTIDEKLSEPPVKKVNHKSSRVLPLIETLKKLILKKDVGVTRLANITGMDRLNLPNYCSYYPTSEEGQITVFGGKGETLEEAKVGAFMEVVERASSQHDTRRVLSCLLRDYMDDVRFLDPRELIIWDEAEEVLNKEIDWSIAWDLQTKRPMFIPSIAAFHFFKGNHLPLFLDTSIGLSCGNTYLEAILYGLFEVIERDAMSLAMVSRNAPNVDLNTLPADIKLLVERIVSERLELEIRYLPNDIGMPAFYVWSTDLDLPQVNLITGGMAADTNAETALRNALLEMVQTRGTIIAGAREDLSTVEMTYEEALADIKGKFADVHISFSEIPNGMQRDSIWEEFLEIRYRLNIAGFRMLFVDLTNPHYQIPVVRVVVPGMENWYSDQDRIGPRLLRAFDERR